MDVDLMIVCAVQIVVLAIVVCGILIYLMRRVTLRWRHDVSHKSILITGCDSGFAFHLARHLDTLGFRIFAGFPNPSGEAAVRLQTETSARLRIVPLDVASQSSVENAAKRIAEQLNQAQQGLWAVVNTASLCVCGELLWQTWQHCDKQIQVNLFGPVRVVRAFLPLLKTCQGRVINVGSLAGQEDCLQPGFSIFTGSKHGIEGFSKALGRELSRHKVDVSLIQPDAISVEKYLFEGHHKNMNEMWDQMTPELRSENQDIFIAYHDRVAREGFDVDDKDSSEDSQDSCLPNYLLKRFEDALLSKRPYPVYTAIPSCWIRFQMALLKLLPPTCRQYFMQHKYKHNIANILKV